MTDRDGPIDLGSVFLGAKGENAEVFERLLLEAFRDHVFWRRNFHPQDGFLVRETEKHLPGYERSISILHQELFGLLGELKAGVPFFSPRYVGHMSSDLTMASLIGYFATMLYNPNNVAAEASPVTSRMELEVARELAEMIGYDPARQWGHLTSGGTVANFEALWVARNVRYLPVAVRWGGGGDGHPRGGGAVRRIAGVDRGAGPLDVAQPPVGERPRRGRAVSLGAGRPIPRAGGARPPLARRSGLPGVRTAADRRLRRRPPSRSGARPFHGALLLGEDLPRPRHRGGAAGACARGSELSHGSEGAAGDAGGARGAPSAGDRLRHRRGNHGGKRRGPRGSGG